MFRGVLFFIVVWILVAAGIIIFRKLKKKEKWNVIKIVSQSAIYAAIALTIVMAIVILF